MKCDHYCKSLDLGIFTVLPLLSQSKPCLWRLKPPKTPSLLHQGKGSSLHPLFPTVDTDWVFSNGLSVLSPHASPKNKVQVLMVGMWQLCSRLQDGVHPQNHTAYPMTHLCSPGTKPRV